MLCADIIVGRCTGTFRNIRVIQQSVDILALHNQNYSLLITKRRNHFIYIIATCEYI